MWIALGVIAFFGVLFIGAVVGVGVTYLVLQNRPVRAAIDLPFGLGSIGDQFDRVRNDKSAFLITDVVPDSPADEAGLVPGDLIVGIDGELVSSGQSLEEIIQAHQPGDEVVLELNSNGDDETRRLEVTLGEHSDDAGRAYLGVSYRTVPDPSLFEKSAVPFHRFTFPDSGEGEAPFFQGPFEILPFGQNIPELPEAVEQAVIVSEVTPESPAEDAGLQPGDVITAVDGEDIGEPKTFAELVRSKDPGDEITLTIYRSGDEGPLEIQATLGEHPEEEGLAYLGVTIGGFSRVEMRSPNLPERFRYYFESPWPGEELEDQPGPET